MIGDFIGEITVEIPNSLLKDMKNYPDIDWNAVAIKAIHKEIVEQIAKKSKLTQKDVDELARKINASAKKKFLKGYLVKKRLSAKGLKFCDKMDWHPVDELPLKKSFVDSMKRKPHYRKLSDKELNKLLGL